VYITADLPKQVGKSFTISFSGECPLTLAEIWPDGDAPANPTSQDVVDRIKATCGDSLSAFFSEWNLEGDVEVSITPSEKVL
jgi:hypothetical protein